MFTSLEGAGAVEVSGLARALSAGFRAGGSRSGWSRLPPPRWVRRSRPDGRWLYGTSDGPSLRGAQRGPVTTGAAARDPDFLAVAVRVSRRACAPCTAGSVPRSGVRRQPAAPGPAEAPGYSRSRRGRLERGSCPRRAGAAAGPGQQRGHAGRASGVAAAEGPAQAASARTMGTGRPPLTCRTAAHGRSSRSRPAWFVRPGTPRRRSRTRPSADGGPGRTGRAG